MKRYAKPLVSAMVAIMALAPAASAFADSGYYVNGKKYLTNDVASHSELLLKLNNEAGIDNVALDLNGARAIYKDFMATNPSLANLSQEFNNYAAAHGYQVPAGTVIVNPDGTTTPDPDAVETGIKVDAVSTIKGTSVTVQLSNVPNTLPAANTFTVTDSNSQAYLVTAIAATNTAGEYVLTLGTQVSGKGTLTVRHGNSEASKAFDSTLDGITLQVTVDDEDATLVANGADNTILSVKVLKDGVADETFEGTVKFISLKGARFAKETVAFNKGVAQVQLTSLSSPVAVVDTIVVAITDADDIKAIGTTANVNVSYVPASQGGDTDEKVFVTYAESDRASDVYVQFNKAFDFADVYAEWAINPSIITVAGKTVTDIVKVDNKTVKLVLDEAQSMNDNKTVTVDIAPINAVSSNLIASTIKFNLVDAKAPEAVGIDIPNYRTLVTRFSEPVVADIAETTTNWVLNGHVLTLDDVQLVKVGKAIVENGQPVLYVADAKNPVDNRNYVTIVLSADGAKFLKGEGKQNLLQAYNIEDYAALTDRSGQNVATTQEFKFVTPVAPNAPIVEVTEDSPEQFRVKFDQPLKDQLAASDFKFEYADGFNADKVTYNYQPLATEAPGFNTAEFVTVTPIGGQDNDEYLLELNTDWTFIHETANTKENYYAPGFNKVKITVDKANVKNILDVQMTENKVQELTLRLDDKSPVIADAYQKTNSAGGPISEFFVKMSEPVQITSSIPNLTPSQEQFGGQGIPTPTFQFVNADQSKTIDGELKGAISEDDMSFTIAPKGVLDAGTWTLYIRSISDDIGNTSATTSYQLEVKGAVAAQGEPRVIWAVAYNDVTGAATATDATYNNGDDVVDIQFGTEMSLDALTSVVYTINGKQLPVGAKVSAIEGKYTVGTTVLTGTRVRITLPGNFLAETGLTSDMTNLDQEDQQSEPHMLVISKKLTSATGEVLKGDYELPLTYRYLNADVDHSK
ncbi:hypothetical protein [Paenibacillus vini]|uniref:Uncharacterized protein n=1 Tax=Paenibacillus vini TaxID=1476024 RepID=A0ABQ4M6F3_9BACL|nr:hypothetical protein [Paenibacillus vini]GIP51583.1 hypothetical protein J42TS3_06180 [Paenibacillus vini]